MCVYNQCAWVRRNEFVRKKERERKSLWKKSEQEREKKEEWKVCERERKECVRKREKNVSKFFPYVSSPRKLILRMEPLIPCWMTDRWEQIVNHPEIGLKVVVHFEQIHSVIQGLEVKPWRNHQWFLLLSTTWPLEVDHLVVVKIRSLVRWFFRVLDRWFFRVLDRWFFRVFWFGDFLIDSLFSWLWWSREWKEGEKKSERRERKIFREEEKNWEGCKIERERERKKRESERESERTDEKSQEGKRSKSVSWMQLYHCFIHTTNALTFSSFLSLSLSMLFLLPFYAFPFFLFSFLLSSLHWFN